MIITMKEIRQAGYCSRGARLFFKRHGFSWPDFLKNGIDVESIEKTNDAMALKVARIVRGR